MKKNIKKIGTLKIVAVMIMLMAVLFVFGGCQTAKKDNVSINSVTVVDNQFNDALNSTTLQLDIIIENGTIWNVKGFDMQISFNGESVSPVTFNSGEYFVRHGKTATVKAFIVVEGKVDGINEYSLTGTNVASYWESYRTFYIIIFSVMGAIFIAYTLYVFICDAEFGEIYSLLDDYGVMGTTIVVLIIGIFVFLIFCEWINFLSIILGIIVLFVACWFMHYLQVFIEGVNELRLNNRDRKLKKKQDGEKLSETAESNGSNE